VGNEIDNWSPRLHDLKEVRNRIQRILYPQPDISNAEAEGQTGETEPRAKVAKVGKQATGHSQGLLVRERGSRNRGTSQRQSCV